MKTQKAWIRLYRQHVVFFVVAISLVVLLIQSGTSLAAQLPLSSPLQSPISNRASSAVNRFWIAAGVGGLRFCDVDTGQTWLNFGSNFTSETGAEVHCDANPTNDAVTKLNQSLFAKTINNRGYLIGVYPKVPLSRAVQFQFKLTNDLSKTLCRPKCAAVGKYYDPTNATWNALPTTFDVKNKLITVELRNWSPRSEYPAYADRLLIAIFKK